MTRYNFLLIFYFVTLWNSLGAVLFGDFLKPAFAIARKAVDRMTLPFPYSEVPAQKAWQAAFVYENFYTVLNDDTQEIGKKYAIVGTIRPCFLIGLRNDKNGKSIVFHKASYSSKDSLVEITRNELAINKEDGRSIRSCIFSNSCFFYDSFPINGNSTWQDLHQGRSQEEEMVFIKNFLMSSLGILYEEQLACQIFKNRFNRLASLSVLVDSELKLNRGLYQITG